METEQWIEVADAGDDGRRAQSHTLERFLWMEDEVLLAVFNEYDGSVSRYRYFDVSRDKFKELYDRTFEPERYSKPIGKWFLRNISESHDYQSIENFQNSKS